MKKTTFIILLLFVLFNSFAIDLTLATKVNNYSSDNTGELNNKKYKYGLFFNIQDQVVENFNINISFDSFILHEYILAGRASYKTEYLELSAGPTFAIFNNTKNSNNFSFLIQPGLGIGFNIISPGLFLAKADTDFALPTANTDLAQGYIQKGEISVGFYLPNLLCSIGIRQDTRTIINDSRHILATTDYGLYTEAHKSGSFFRTNVDFIFRITESFLPDDPLESFKDAHLVLGGELVFIPNTNFNFFISGTGSVFSTPLEKFNPKFDSFLFEINTGVNFKVFPKIK